MKVVYFYAGMYGGKDYPEQRRLARISIDSVRRAMPGAEIVHLADTKFRPLYGVDSVVRFEIKPGVNRADIQALVDGDCLFFDTDTIMLEDVSPIFHEKFQVAVSGMSGGALKYNQGVVFSRCPEFWVDVANRARDYGVYDERAFNDAATCGKFDVKEIADVYNFSVPPDLKIMHFKGARKKSMLCLMS